MSLALATTTITVAGTPTVFMPLPTAWPSHSGCASNNYLHTPVADPNTFIAWDPLYGAAMVTSAQSCLPPQVTAWWQQPSSSIYTALGPDFQCPEAYSAVQTVVVASSLHQTFCCPSQYSLLVPQANVAKAFPSQCVSIITSGQEFVHITSQKLEGQSVTTEIMNASATVFAIPVNGFAFAAATASSLRNGASSTRTSTPSNPPPSSATSSATPAPSSTPAGVYAGIVVGVVGGVVALAGLILVLFRRRRQRQAAEKQNTYPETGTQDLHKQPGWLKHLSLGAHRSRLSSQKVYELPGH